MEQGSVTLAPFGLRQNLLCSDFRVRLTSIRHVKIIPNVINLEPPLARIFELLPVGVDLPGLDRLHERVRRRGD